MAYKLMTIGACMATLGLGLVVFGMLWIAAKEGERGVALAGAAIGVPLYVVLCVFLLKNLGRFFAGI